MSGKLGTLYKLGNILFELRIIDMLKEREYTRDEVLGLNKLREHMVEILPVLEEVKGDATKLELDTYNEFIDARALSLKANAPWLFDYFFLNSLTAENLVEAHLQSRPSDRGIVHEVFEYYSNIVGDKNESK